MTETCRTGTGEAAATDAPRSFGGVRVAGSGPPRPERRAFAVRAGPAFSLRQSSGNGLRRRTFGE